MLNKITQVNMEFQKKIHEVHEDTDKYILDQIEIRSKQIEEFVKDNDLIDDSTDQSDDEEILEKYNKTWAAIEIMKQEIETLDANIQKIVKHKDTTIRCHEEFMQENYYDSLYKFGIFIDNRNNILKSLLLFKIFEKLY